MAGFYVFAGPAVRLRAIFNSKTRLSLACILVCFNWLGARRVHGAHVR